LEGIAHQDVFTTGIHQEATPSLHLVVKETFAYNVGNFGLHPMHIPDYDNEGFSVGLFGPVGKALHLPTVALGEDHVSHISTLEHGGK